MAIISALIFALVAITIVAITIVDTVIMERRYRANRTIPTPSLITTPTTTNPFAHA